MKATWNNTVVAESHETVVVDGNHYFPVDTIKREYFCESSRTTVCPWKGTASYFDLTVGGAVNPAAAWYYPETKPKADNIRGMVAFWQGVSVSE